MTTERKEFAEALGLFDKEDDPARAEDKRVALRYLLSGANIPQSLLARLERGCQVTFTA